MSDGRPYSKHARVRSRRSIIQAYYQWILTQRPVREIIAEFKTDRTELKKADIEYFRTVLEGMVRNSAEMELELQPFLDRPLAELDPVERSVLNLGQYELMYQPETPYRVVINEAVDLAKMFGAEQSHKYVNGVLDKLARKFRQVETRTAGG